MTRQYPNLEIGLRIATEKGRLYTHWYPERGRCSPTEILGVMYAGIPFDGKFLWSVIDDFLHDQQIPNISTLMGEDREVWMHVAVAGGGMFTTETLYGISIREDSKIYTCELDRAKLYPKLAP